MQPISNLGKTEPGRTKGLSQSFLRVRVYNTHTHIGKTDFS